MSSQPPKERERIEIPASDRKRYEIALLALCLHWQFDPKLQEAFRSSGLEVGDLSLEDILDMPVGMAMKLTEQHILHARNFHNYLGQVEVMDYIRSHIRLMGEAHRAGFSQIGYDYPVDSSVETIEGYVAHFLKYSPDEGAVPIPEFLVIEIVQLVLNIYTGRY